MFCAMITAMPRDGAIIFSDLIGKLDVLRVSCNKLAPQGLQPLGLPLGRLPQTQVCNMRPRGGRQQLDLGPRYTLVRLVHQRGRDAKIIDWLDDCPKKITHSMWSVRGEVSATNHQGGRR
jgi:hypothetical protein